MDGRVPVPHIMGHEMSGTIVDVGTCSNNESGVDVWEAGQRVVVRPIQSCGTCQACLRGHGHICQRLNFIGIDSPGAFQALWTVPAHTLHQLPAELSFEQAALIEPLAVACHDIRLAGLQPGEEAVVIGAGPIGTIVSLVARHAGAHVLVSEVNPFRVQFARDLGFDVVNPKEQDLVAAVDERTGGGGADVVFEVSGTQAGATVMTKLLRTRGRAVIVAIFAEAPKIDLFQLFLRELQLYGVRVYEHEDFERAIKLAQQGALPLEALITEHRGLDSLQGVFEEMQSGGEIMKVLIDTQG